MKIIVSGRAVAYKIDSEEEITDPTKLKKLDGLLYAKGDNSDGVDPYLEVLGVQGGAVRLRYNKQTNGLRVTTEYASPHKLSREQLKKIAIDTVRQWSDGIGEEDFQFRKKLKMDVDRTKSPLLGATSRTLRY